MVEATYRDGKPDDYRRMWFPNGNMERKEFYKDGKREGVWTFWNESGRMIHRVTYKDGEKISE